MELQLRKKELELQETGKWRGKKEEGWSWTGGKENYDGVVEETSLMHCQQLQPWSLHFIVSLIIIIINNCYYMKILIQEVDSYKIKVSNEGGFKSE